MFSFRKDIINTPGDAQYELVWKKEKLVCIRKLSERTSLYGSILHHVTFLQTIPIANTFRYNTKISHDLSQHSEIFSSKKLLELALHPFNDKRKCINIMESEP